VDAKRARILVASILSVGLVTPLVVASAAAATCALSAPATAPIGAPFTIVGSGFPANTNVDVSLAIDGGSPDAFSAQSDAQGALQIVLTPEAADVGTTVVTATAGAGCTAQATYTVGGTGGVVAPAPTEVAVAPAPTEVAVGNTAAGPPRTDGSTVVGGQSGTPRSAVWILGIISLLIGIGGYLASRPARAR
jgi:hypothetical protein